MGANAPSISRPFSFTKSLTSGDAVSVHERTQHLRNGDGTVRLLIVLQNRDPRTAGRKARAVQRVYELALSGLALKADACAARLKRFTIGAAGNLHELICRGQPDFDVIGLR